MRASTICGSDLRAIYREHLGEGPEAYQGVVAGHEPCGEVVAVGPGCRERAVGDRVVVYHISGCGLCDECRAGYRISCTSPLRRAYGWQRDGGHADLLLADEEDLVPLPDGLSSSTARASRAASAPPTRRCGAPASRAATPCSSPASARSASPPPCSGRALGAPRVIGSDPSPVRRELAGASAPSTTSWAQTRTPPSACAS